MSDKKLNDPNDTKVKESTVEDTALSSENLQDLENELEDELEDESAAEEDYKDKWLRAVADLDNMRRRFDKEKEDIASYSTMRFAKELLSIADNLGRALESSSQEEGAGLYQGVILTQKELEKVFQKFGIFKIDALHKPFDPHLHQAMLEEDNPQMPAGTVLRVLQEGYCLYERLLRPALVCVSTRSA